MLICLECQCVFDQPKRLVERHGLDTPPYEEYDACPYCFSADIHPAAPCDICGTWLTGGYIKTLDGQRICEDCYTLCDAADD